MEVADLLQRLPECATRDDCDAFAVSFCLVATKSARRRLVRPASLADNEAALGDHGTHTHACASPSTMSTLPHIYSTLPTQVEALCNVPWGQLQVIPYYARIAATLNPIFPEFAPGGDSLTLSIAFCFGERKHAAAPACGPSLALQAPSAKSDR